MVVLEVSRLWSGQMTESVREVESEDCRALAIAFHISD